MHQPFVIQKKKGSEVIEKKRSTTFSVELEYKRLCVNSKNMEPFHLF